MLCLPADEIDRKEYAEEMTMKKFISYGLILALLLLLSPCVFASSTNQFLNTNVGDTVFLGKYEQDNNLNNGMENISWIVLEKNQDRALIVSKFALDCQPYNSTYAELTWADCSLRHWMNEVFLTQLSTRLSKL